MYPTILCRSWVTPCTSEIPRSYVPHSTNLGSLGKATTKHTPTHTLTHTLTLTHSVYTHTFFLSLSPTLFLFVPVSLTLSFFCTPTHSPTHIHTNTHSFFFHKHSHMHTCNSQLTWTWSQPPLHQTTPSGWERSSLPLVPAWLHHHHRWAKSTEDAEHFTFTVNYMMHLMTHQSVASHRMACCAARNFF